MRDVYLIKSVAHAAKLLAAFETGGILTPKDLITQTGLSRGIVHRLLYTLERERVTVQTQQGRSSRLEQHLGVSAGADRSVHDQTPVSLA